MGRNILIVESNNDKYFFQSVIKHLDLDISISAPIFLDEDFRAMAGSDATKLTSALKDLKADIQKEDIERIGVIVDIDRHSEADRIKFINDCLIKVFPNAVPLDRVNQFIDLNVDDHQIQLACYFTNVDGRGELETVLKAIKSQDSTYADCLQSWRDCLTINGKEITDKIFGKLWVNIYVSYDIPTTNKEKRDAEKKLTVSYALQNKPSIWNLDHPALNKMKVFFGLFHDSPPPEITDGMQISQRAATLDNHE